MIRLAKKKEQAGEVLIDKVTQYLALKQKLLSLNLVFEDIRADAACAPISEGVVEGGTLVRQTDAVPVKEGVEKEDIS